MDNKNLKIGNITLKNRLLLAPMVDVTDSAYRELCRDSGAAMAYTEMIVVDSIINENEHTKKLMKIDKSDKPSGIQITGDSIESFKKAIPYLKRYDIVDINCGCPSSRIKECKAGSYLLKDPKKIASIIKLLKSAGLIVTAKIRLGFDKDESIRIAKTIENAGADAITVHARLANQGNDVPADWKKIEAIKSSVKIPVIGNGDVFNAEDAKNMLDICDGCMIARGAIGNPLIFRQALEYIEKGKKTDISLKENLSCFKKYIELSKNKDVIEIPRIKYIGSKFIKGARGAAELRNKIMHLSKYDEILLFVEELIKKCD